MWDPSARACVCSLGVREPEHALINLYLAG